MSKLDRLFLQRLTAFPRHDIRASAHSDYGSVTLLLCEGQPGLQVRGADGSWNDAEHYPGALIVNIADALEVCSPYHQLHNLQN